VESSSAESEPDPGVLEDIVRRPVLFAAVVLDWAEELIEGLGHFPS